VSIDGQDLNTPLELKETGTMDSLKETMLRNCDLLQHTLEIKLSAIHSEQNVRLDQEQETLEQIKAVTDFTAQYLELIELPVKG